ncbi:uncharacterized protein BXZ73DRAFT_78917 [Epithele typhae]|uniref:uncharacterized protein n=1 Tax=Epithele typhae TaxID=378194 RepID=UPI0020080791|nr:uncharacterized protein BXZ73DRAFT_78917 [Epithele typhae]KAH9925943.1 hypothetical protein BXZ73DRAFT_78917 [Epithele typhae]
MCGFRSGRGGAGRGGQVLVAKTKSSEDPCMDSKVQPPKGQQCPSASTSTLSYALFWPGPSTRPLRTQVRSYTGTLDKVHAWPEPGTSARSVTLATGAASSLSCWTQGERGHLKIQRGTNCSSRTGLARGGSSSNGIEASVPGPPRGFIAGTGSRGIVVAVAYRIRGTPVGILACAPAGVVQATWSGRCSLVLTPALLPPTKPPVSRAPFHRPDDHPVSGSKERAPLRLWSSNDPSVRHGLQRRRGSPVRDVPRPPTSEPSAVFPVPPPEETVSRYRRGSHATTSTAPGTGGEAINEEPMARPKKRTKTRFAPESTLYPTLHAVSSAPAVPLRFPRPSMTQVAEQLAGISPPVQAAPRVRRSKTRSRHDTHPQSVAGPSSHSDSHHHPYARPSVPPLAPPSSSFRAAQATSFMVPVPVVHPEAASSANLTPSETSGPETAPSKDVPLVKVIQSHPPESSNKSLDDLDYELPAPDNSIWRKADVRFDGVKVSTDEKAFRQFTYDMVRVLLKILFTVHGEWKKRKGGHPRPVRPLNFKGTMLNLEWAWKKLDVWQPIRKRRYIAWANGDPLPPWPKGTAPKLGDTGRELAYKQDAEESKKARLKGEPKKGKRGAQEIVSRTDGPSAHPVAAVQEPVRHVREPVPQQHVGTPQGDLPGADPGMAPEFLQHLADPAVIGEIFNIDDPSLPEQIANMFIPQIPIQQAQAYMTQAAQLLQNYGQAPPPMPGQFHPPGLQYPLVHNPYAFDPSLNPFAVPPPQIYYQLPFYSPPVPDNNNTLMVNGAPQPGADLMYPHFTPAAMQRLPMAGTMQPLPPFTEPTDPAVFMFDVPCLELPASEESLYGATTPQPSYLDDPLSTALAKIPVSDAPQPYIGPSQSGSHTTTIPTTQPQDDTEDPPLLRNAAPTPVIKPEDSLVLPPEWFEFEAEAEANGESRDDIDFGFLHGEDLKDVIEACTADFMAELEESSESGSWVTDGGVSVQDGATSTPITWPSDEATGVAAVAEAEGSEAGVDGGCAELEGTLDGAVSQSGDTDDEESWGEELCSHSD